MPEIKDQDLIKSMNIGTSQSDASLIVDPEDMDHQKGELERRCCDLLRKERINNMIYTRDELLTETWC